MVNDDRERTAVKFAEGEQDCHELSSFLAN